MPNIDDLLNAQHETVADSLNVIELTEHKEPYRPEVYQKNSFGTAESLKKQELLDAIKEHDPKIFGLLECCIANGVKTFASCQGHPEEMPIGKKTEGYIGFYDLDNQHIQDIIRFASTYDVYSHIRVYNDVKHEHSRKDIDQKCTINWPASQTISRSNQLIGVINGEYDLTKSKTPQIISLMLELSKECSRLNIGFSSARRGVSEDSSNGGFDFYKGILQFQGILEIARNGGLRIDLDNCEEKFSWDYKMGDEKVCETLREIIDFLKNS